MADDILIFESPEELAAAAAGLLMDAAEARVASRHAFSLALSGGRTPRGMYRLLAREPYFGRIPWAETHLFWVDERCVPQKDPASNYGAAFDDFLSKVPVPSSQIHPMKGHLTPERGAADYEEELRRFFEDRGIAVPRFDFLVLGLGDEGHTASLFPRHASLEEKTRWVTAAEGGEPHVKRLTLTLPVINRAKQIVFMISGEEKAEAVRRLLVQRDQAMPASRVRPVEGRLSFLMDRAAAFFLEQGGKSRQR